MRFISEILERLSGEMALSTAQGCSVIDLIVDLKCPRELFRGIAVGSR